MKSFFMILAVIVTFFSSLTTSSTPPYICGSDRITGQVTTSDPENTSVQIQFLQESVLVRESSAEIAADGSYTVIFPEDLIQDDVYTIVSRATLGELDDTWSYTTYIGDACNTCGNGILDAGEQCEENSDCAEGLFCGACSCISRREMRSLITSYADEVAEFKQYQTQQTVPERFFATGRPFAFIDSLIERLGVRFTSSSRNVYNTLPDRTIDPLVDVSEIPLESIYGSLPVGYQHKAAYLQVKGLFVPIEFAGKYATESQVLDILNQGAVLAPETPSMNTLGAVKMIYAHAVSTTPSPFAGIGSYISLFTEVGDDIFVYIRTGERSYEKRTYTIRSKLSLKPEQTDLLHTFSKEGIDALALITCRDGNVLGSLAGREIIVANRAESELGNFQKTILTMGDDAQLQRARKLIDRYLAQKDFDEEHIGRLVAQIERLSTEETANPFHVIATYGKYMAAYDAVYNDKVYEG